MTPPRFPSLYQINTRAWLGELGRQRGAAATFDDVPDDALDRFAEMGFDWIWLLGVWQLGSAGRAYSRSRDDWRDDFEKALPDLSEDDIVSSPFAVQAYAVHVAYGGDAALARLRERLRKRGIALLLDFVPNHIALDHPWAVEHPEYCIVGSAEDLAREPHNYIRIKTRDGPRILAHGRDPYFPGWRDSLQLNYRCQALRETMMNELASVADRCDGVRCDMAMLLLPEIIERVWGPKSQPANGSAHADAPFWPEAIARVRARVPKFCFLAEVYWDLEWELQQQGFDYTYDKRLYDRLLAREAGAVRGHLRADREFQRKSVRFLENHDEPRAAQALPLDVHRAAAVITFLVPGMRFFHEGQLEGRRQHLSNHLGRRPVEPIDAAVQAFYRQILELLRMPVVRTGDWRLLNCQPAWDGNPTWNQFIALLWTGSDGSLLIAVNYGLESAQCYVGLDGLDVRGRSLQLRDALSDIRYWRDGTDLAERGLYLDMTPWQAHVFETLEAGS